MNFIGFNGFFINELYSYIFNEVSSFEFYRFKLFFLYRPKIVDTSCLAFIRLLLAEVIQLQKFPFASNKM